MQKDSQSNTQEDLVSVVDEQTDRREIPKKSQNGE
jgi:hypothetical protein